MAHIFLTDGNARRKFDLPDSVTGIDGQSFRFGYVVRSGGNGTVFESRPPRARSNVAKCAVKCLHQQDQTRLDRFKNEVRIMRDLSHERIATLYDSGELDLGSGYIVPWLAMELGGDNLKVHVQQNGPIPVDQLKSIGADICGAISHIHGKEIIHRDIKPDNFVWDPAAQGRVKMIDFGIAKYIGEDTSGRPLDDFTRQMEFVGPVFFSSPELIAYASDKSHPVTVKSDLFQLGKLLWFLGTGIVSAGIPARKACPAGGRLRELVVELIDDDPDSRVSETDEIVRRLAVL